MTTKDVNRRRKIGRICDGLRGGLSYVRYSTANFTSTRIPSHHHILRINFYPIHYFIIEEPFCLQEGENEGDKNENKDEATPGIYNKRKNKAALAL